MLGLRVALLLLFLVAISFPVFSDETDDDLERVGLGPEELSMLDDFEVKLLRDSIRGVGSVSKVPSHLADLFSGKVPDVELGPSSSRGLKRIPASEDEMIPFDGSQNLTQVIIPPPKHAKHKDDPPTTTTTAKPRHSLRVRKTKKPKKAQQSKENSSDLTAEETKRLTTIIEALLAKKKNAVKALNNHEGDWEEDSDEGERSETSSTTTVAPPTPPTLVPWAVTPTTLTQHGQWAVSQSSKKKNSERRGLSVITEPEGGDDDQVDFSLGGADEHPTPPKSEIFRAQENHSHNTDEILDGKLIDSEVQRSPEEWEEKMRALTKELSVVLQKLKADKEATGQLKRSNYDARDALVPLSAVNTIDGHTNADTDEQKRVRPKRAYVSILREGLARQTDINEYVFVASITLIRDQNQVVLVDTGLATDINGRTDLLKIPENFTFFKTMHPPDNVHNLAIDENLELGKLNIAPPQVNFVVTTHGHADHSGNTNDFPDALHFQGNMLHHRTKFNFSDLFERDTHQLTPNVQLIKTPGHTPDDIAVIVRNTDKYGTIAIAGDVFIAEEDMEFPLMWKPMAWNVRIQEKSRQRLICEADYIVPGHGKVFKVTPDIRQRVKCTAATKIES